MAKMGRPKIKLDYELISKLSHIQCTQVEIASVLGIALNTLKNDKDFLPIYKKGMEEGKISLRRLQWKAANKDNVTMLIWLGKQYLNQTDKQEISGAEPIQITLHHDKD